MIGWLLCRLSFHDIRHEHWAIQLGPNPRSRVICARPGCNWPYL
jgi:hypothetical protein